MAANGNSHSCGAVLALKIPGYECGFCSMGQPEPDQQEPEPVSPEKLMEIFEVKKDYVNKLGKEEYLVPNLLIRSHVVTIISMPGGGKTSIWYFFVAPMPASQGLKVWYIDADSPASDHKHMKEVADSHGCKFLNPDVNPGPPWMGYLTPSAKLPISTTT